MDQNETAGSSSQNKHIRVGRVKRWLAGVAILLLLLTAAARYFAPEIFYSVETRWQLWASGVRTVSLAGARGMERNLCASNASACNCVLLIHGMGDSSVTWRRLLTADESRLPKPRMIALDLPGMGETPLPESMAARQVSAIGKQYAEILKERACAETIVVGNSFGGWVALWTALQAKRMDPAQAPRISRVISFSGTGLKRGEAEDDFFRELQEQPTVARLQEFQKRAYFKPRVYPDSFWEAAAKRAQASKAPSLSAAQDDAQDLGTADFKGFPEFDYYWGEADRIVSKPLGEELVQRIPGGRLHVIPECGHLPQKECPEVVLDAITSRAGSG